MPEIDRLTPIRSPRGRVVMYQKWRDLLFLHWPIPVEELRPLVPLDLEIDLYDGIAYVGLVPFLMTGVRPVGLPPVRGLSTFCETNVRTYVHFQGRDPGVWFFSLDAANSLAVKLARAWFHLPYYFSRMYLKREYEVPDRPEAGLRRDFSPILYAGSRHRDESLPSSYSIRAHPIEEPRMAMPGTLEHFLVERYILYVYSASGQLCRGHVAHLPYPIQNAQSSLLSESLLSSNKIHATSAPQLSHFSSGVDVKVFNLLRVD